MSKRPVLTVRQLHAYIGMLVAPTVLFLACTGVLQIYNLHEAHGSYTPAPIIEKLSAIHKDQVFKVEDDGPPGPPQAGPSAGTGAGPPPHEHHRPKLAVTLLKAYFAGVAIALIVSTLAGLWMAFTQGIRRKTYAWLLAIGIVVPAVLGALTG